MPNPDVPSPSPLVFVEQQPQVFVPGAERRRDRVLRWSRSGVVLAGVATHRIATRTVWWGGWGLLAGVGVFAGLWALDLLLFPWPRARVPILVALGLLYPVAGAGCWGHAGFWRGVGRFALVVGVERGGVATLTRALLARTEALLRRSGRVDRWLDRGELWVGDLPLARWEELLKGASTSVLGEADPDGEGFVRRFVVRRIERYTLRVVRKEIARGHGGGVSMAKVRERVLLGAEDAFRDGVVGLMNEQLLAMSALFLALSAVPPLLAWVLRWALSP